MQEIDPMITAALKYLPADFAGFDRVYDAKLRPELERLEAARLGAASKAKQGYLYGGAVGVIGLLAGLLILATPILGGFSAVIGFITAAVMGSDLRTIGKQAKSLMVQPIAQEFQLDYQEAPGVQAGIADFRSAKLLPGWDRQNFEDRLTGTRKGTSFEFFEAHLEVKRQTRDSNGRMKTRWVTVFRGQCLRFKFAKSFLGRTLVARDAGFFNRFGGGDGMRIAKLEDPKFEKLFTVYTTDQVESRFLLTPDFMQRLVDLEDAFHGGKLRCAFVAGEILIALEGGDLFEPGSMFKPMDNPERVRELLMDFAAVFHLIDSASGANHRTR